MNAKYFLKLLEFEVKFITKTDVEVSEALQIAERRTPHGENM
jgi:hypothetical protein